MFYMALRALPHDVTCQNARRRMYYFKGRKKLGNSGQPIWKHHVNLQKEL